MQGTYDHSARHAVIRDTNITNDAPHRIFVAGKGPYGQVYQASEKRVLMVGSRLMRNVSIVGTNSHVLFSFDQPLWQGYSMYEPWACAISQALEDANIRPKDVDKIRHSQFAYIPTHTSPPWATSARPRTTSRSGRD